MQDRNARIDALISAADQRDRQAERRDSAARARDDVAHARDRDQGINLDARSRSAAHDRDRSAVDRIRAGEDRDHAAAERAELRDPDAAGTG